MHFNPIYSFITNAEIGILVAALIVLTSIRIAIWRLKVRQKELRRLLARNEEVLRFRQRNIRLCYDYYRRHPYDFDKSLVDKLEDPTYEQMLYSKKPLVLEEWYDSQTLEKIFS